jgi:hypothetical protein
MIGLAFTDEQFGALLKMIYVANTVGNSPSEGMVLRKDFDEIEQYIFSRAKDVFPMAVYEHKEGSEKHHHPSLVFESDPDVNALMDQYEAYVTKYVISEKLAERDVEVEFGLHSKDKMSSEQYEELVEERALEYRKILETKGFRSLRLDM